MLLTYGVVHKSVSNLFPVLDEGAQEVGPEDSRSQFSISSSTMSSITSSRTPLSLSRSNSTSWTLEGSDDWKREVYDRCLLATVSANLPFMWIENREVRSFLNFLNPRLAVRLYATYKPKVLITFMTYKVNTWCVSTPSKFV